LTRADPEEGGSKKDFFGNLLDPENFCHTFYFSKIRIAGDDGRFMFRGRSEGKAVRIGDAKLGFIFGSLEY
jgi:hypothetical protein